MAGIKFNVNLTVSEMKSGQFTSTICDASMGNGLYLQFMQRGHPLAIKLA
jgi:hypothetical protein